MTEPTKPRLGHFDDLRTLVVLIVVLLHVADAYMATGTVPWIVADPRTNIAFDCFNRINDIFTMPVLFFVAGFFTLPSLARRSIGGFVYQKAWRLGLPYLLSIAALTPPILYVGHLLQGTWSRGYLAYWSRGYWPEAECRHLWFALVLFGLMAVTAVVRAIWPAAFEPRPPGKTRQPSLLWLLGFSALIATCFFLVNLVVADGTWLRLVGTGVFKVQATRLTLYAGYFILGILARRDGWTFTSGVFARRHLRWHGVATLGAIAGQLGFAYLFYRDMATSIPIKAANALLHSLTCLLLWGALVAWFTRHLDAAGDAAPERAPWRAWLAANSYGIYILHLPLVVLMQYALLGWDVSPFLKFPVIPVVVIPVSALLSAYVLRRLPLFRRAV